MNAWTDIHFMPILSSGCQASCKYCFGPNKGNTIREKDIDRLIDFIKYTVNSTGQKKVNITFHGGEPLLAQFSIWEKIFTKFEKEFSEHKLIFSLQSNLWNLSPELCTLFKKYNVSIGTSLDGPKEINDVQRGKGYFDKTFEKINLASSYELKPGVISTFTSLNVKDPIKIFNFFLQNRLYFSIHPCVDSMNKMSNPLTLKPEDLGELLCGMMDLYVPNRHFIQVSTLDQMILSFIDLEGKACTFRDCLGMFLSICPDGNIYSCQRFVGHNEFALGNIHDKPTLKDLMSSPVARMIERRQKKVRIRCADCKFYLFCKGGCLYNAWMANSDIDPYCSAYKRLFSKISNDLLNEISQIDNVNELVSRPNRFLPNPLLRKGSLIDLTSKKAHPTKKVENALKIISIVELAKNNSSNKALSELKKMGIQTNNDYLKKLYESIFKEKIRHNNLYLHLSYKCQLSCSHCYISSDSNQKDFFPASKVKELVLSSINAGFRQVVFTGGEPLIYPEIEKLLEILTDLKNKKKGILFVLRSNFVNRLTNSDFQNIGNAFDKIKVSLDGDEHKHDLRRGKGSYIATTKNIAKYQLLRSRNKQWAELSLASVMHNYERQSEGARAIYNFALEHNISDLRFKPILPIGRAMNNGSEPVSEALSSFKDIEDILLDGYPPVSTCGMGNNLYIAPNGDAFPCYAFKKSHSCLGNINIKGLSKILNSKKFKDLSKHNVDTNPKCRECDYRYLCGGACRAWGHENTQYDLDSAPPECSGLYSRAEEIYHFALNYLIENNLINNASLAH